MRKRNLVPAAFLATALMVEGAIAVSRRGQSSVKAHGSFQLDMRDFESKYPSSLGLAVAREVEVKVEKSVEDAAGISRGILTASPRDH